VITISTSSAEFSQRLASMLDKAERPRAVLMAAGRELAIQLRQHFRTKDRDEPNKLSPRREHFWLQVMRSVNAPEQKDEKSVSVRISDPRIAQKVFGGTISAKRAGALTIPVSEKAYGRTAATFEVETGLKLFLLKSSSGKAPVLAAKVGGTSGTGQQVEVEYVLVKSVTQAADPTALPEEGYLKAKILERAQKVADRQSEK
jgi:hypothetical protein